MDCSFVRFAFYLPPRSFYSLASRLIYILGSSSPSVILLLLSSTWMGTHFGITSTHWLLHLLLLPFTHSAVSTGRHHVSSSSLETDHPANPSQWSLGIDGHTLTARRLTWLENSVRPEKTIELCIYVFAAKFIVIMCRGSLNEGHYGRTHDDLGWQLLTSWIQLSSCYSCLWID